MQRFPGRSAFVDHFGSLGAGAVFAPFLADGLTPVAALLRLGPNPLGRFLLESVEQGERLGRWSFVGAGASELVAFDGQYGLVFRAHPRDGVIYEADRWASRDPLSELRERLRPWRVPTEVVKASLDGAPRAARELPPFFGGAVGFLGYDVVRTIERLGTVRPDPVGTWEAGYLLADTVVVFDHLRRMGYVVALARWDPVGGDPGAAYAEASERVARVWERLHGPGGADGVWALSAAVEVPAAPVRDPGGAAVEDEAFEQAVRRARRYIEAGDIFQVVLS
ncbi:MAG: hypothetical protein AB1609_21290, partial [Bacillota bacterium]